MFIERHPFQEHIRDTKKEIPTEGTLGMGRPLRFSFVELTAERDENYVMATAEKFSCQLASEGPYTADGVGR